MAGLNKQMVDIPFTGGVDTATDAKLVIPSKMAVLQNCAFGAKNTLSKLGGFTGVTTTTSAGGTPTNLVAMHARGGSVLLEGNTNQFLHVPDPTGTYTVGSHDVTWLNSGYRSSVRVRDMLADSVNPGPLQSVSMASNGQLNVVVADDGTEKLIRVETVEGALIALHRSLVYNGIRVVWDSTDSVFRLFYTRAALGLYTRTIVPTAPTALTAEVAITGVAPAGENIDAVFDATTGNSFVVYQTSANAVWYVAWTGSGLAFFGTVTPPGPLSIVSVGIAVNGATVLFALGHTTGVYAFRTTTSFTGASAGLAVSGAGTNVRRVALCSAGATGFRLLFEDSTVAAANTHTFIGSRQIEPNGALAPVETTTGSIRNLGLVSKPFVVGDHAFAVGVYYSTSQPTLFLMRVDSITSPVARMLTQQAGGYQTAGVWLNGGVTDVCVTGSEVALPVFRRNSDANYSSTTAVGDLAVTSVKIGAGTARPLTSVEFGTETVLAGGAPLVWDGVLLQEAGFHHAPNEETATATDIGAGSIPAGTYQWVFTYEFTDNVGRRWQSAPSLPIELTVGANRSVDLSVQSLYLTSRNTAATSDNKLSVVAWRNQGASGAVFQRIGSVQSVTGLSVTINDDVSNTTLQGNEILYTTGGVLENAPFPPHRLTCLHQERLFMAGLEDPYELAYTEQLRIGHAPTTANEYRLRVPETYGEITGIKSIDDKLVVFCERGVWYFYGEGPNRLGQFDNYSFAQNATADMGCRMDSPKSLVATPDGIWFRAAQGLRLLGRSMQVMRDAAGKYAGADVDESLLVLANGAPIVSAFSVPGSQQVRFYMGVVVRALVYDSQWGQWSTLTGHAAVDAAAVGSNVYHLTSGGLFRADSSNEQAGAEFFMSATTAWLKLSTLTGFQRIYEVHVLGETLGESNLRIDTAFDYESAVVDSANPAPLGAPLLLRHRLSRQKCTAVRFTLTENTSGGGAAGGFIWTALSILVGIKPGAYKLPSTRTH